jgi:hypothetical protein
VPLYAGLCCTHYGYVSDRLCAALGAAVGRPVQPLNPNARMVEELELGARGETALAGVAATGAGGGAATGDGGGMSVEVVSKVTLEPAACQAIARLVAPVSPATAQALLSYAHVPDLF